MATSTHIALMQMNRALESVGMKATVVTDLDRLLGAVIEAETFLRLDQLEAARKVLREALQEQKEI